MDPLGFLKHRRQDPEDRPVEDRKGDWREITIPEPEEELARQAGRCMDCGIPYCHAAGCPVYNRIPEFNDLVHRGKWREASENLHATNNFPEITGRVCPAPCETACTLAINDDAVLIKHIEYQIAERAFLQGWVAPRPPRRLTGRKVAVVGSGPAGLACAQQARRLGHDVVVFEKSDRVGGLLRYGIPDFKLDKRILDRRIEQLVAEGIEFRTGIEVGEDISPRYLKTTFDAVCLAMGAGVPRNLDVPGRELAGIHFAMEYLTQQNKLNAGDAIDPSRRIAAGGKAVLVVGGGDTGSDCIGTAIRQGAREVCQFEILPRPPEEIPPDTPWPLWPRILRTSSSQEEGCERRWSVHTKRCVGDGARVAAVEGAEVEWLAGNGAPTMREKPGTDFALRADLVLLAMGFVHVEHAGIVERLGLKLDARGNLAVANYMTSEPGVFAAGDAILGASLVVRAIDAGRRAAAAMHRWLVTR